MTLNDILLPGTKAGSLQSQPQFCWLSCMGVEQSIALTQTEFVFVKVFALNTLSGLDAIKMWTREFGVISDPG